MHSTPILRGPLLAALLGGAMLASGCATPLGSLSPQPAARTPLNAFALEGRLSASDGERAASGRLEWQHRDQVDHWTILSPLGQVLAQLDRSPAGAMLRMADGSRHAADDADQLLPRIIGIDAPTSRLSAWVQAAPSPEAEIRQRDASGRPALVIDAGWRIEYPSYTSEDPGAPPRRIELTRGDAHLRLIIDSWTPLP